MAGSSFDIFAQTPDLTGTYQAAYLNARRQALDDANAQAGGMGAAGDTEGAKNYLIAHGFPDASKFYSEQKDAADKTAASGRIADAFGKGDWNSGMAESIRSGQPQTANYLANLRGSNTNYANGAEDRVKASAQDIMTKFGNAARLAKDDGEYGRILDYAKTHGMTDADEYRSPEGRAILYGKAGVAPDILQAQQQAQQQAARTKTDPVAQVQAEFKAKYGEDLPYTTATGVATALTSKFSAGERLSGWNKDQASAQWVPQWAADPNTTASVRQAAVDPVTQYNRSVATQAGKNTGQNLGREQQSVYVNRHYDLAAELAGGWEPDDSKLTPPQAQQRAAFNAAVGPLRGQAPTLYGLVTGEIAPNSTTPVVIRDLASINQMIKGEVTRLATQGQGVVAEGIRHEFDHVVGNFATSPSVQTYLNVLAFQKKMMGAFTGAKDVGYEAVQNLKAGRQPMAPRADAAPSATPSAQAQPPQPGEVRRGYQYMGGDPANPQSWQQVR